jgi:hypothetical protein
MRERPDVGLKREPPVKSTNSVTSEREQKQSPRVPQPLNERKIAA